MSGLNFGILSKTIFSGKNCDYYFELADLILRGGGGKLYIDIPFYKIYPLSKEEHKSLAKEIIDKQYGADSEFNVVFKKNSYQYRKYNSNHYFVDEYWKLRYENHEPKPFELVIDNTNQAILSTNFILDIFREIDKENFIDGLALKYFTYEHRSDRVNFYLSKKLMQDNKLLSKLLDIINTLILNYQKLGLKFNQNSFVLPYDYDKKNRIIANVYIADSFNKSLIYFLELYRNLNEELCEKFFTYNEIKSDDYLEKKLLIKKLKSYLKTIQENNQEIEFESFVLKIFDFFQNKSEFKNLDGYVKSYQQLFRY